MSKIDQVALEFFHNDDPNVTPEQWLEQLEFAADILDVVIEMLPVDHPQSVKIAEIAHTIRIEQRRKEKERESK